MAFRLPVPWLCFAALIHFGASVGMTDEVAAVVRWIRQNAVPLQTVEAENGFTDMQPLRNIVGGARIVSLGESTHGTREIFQMKHRVLEFLVGELGFTVFGIEASFPDCIPINEYVLHGQGDARAALRGQGFWTWNTEEVLELIRWMRRYNANPNHEIKIKFYGFDMQNSASALRRAFSYLEPLDPDFVRDYRKPLVVLTRRNTPGEYADLTPWRREAMQQALAMLVEHFDQNKQKYIEQTSASAWALARQHAVVAGQCEEMIRSQVDDPPSPGQSGVLKCRRTIQSLCSDLHDYILRVDPDLLQETGCFLGRLQDSPSAALDAYIHEFSQDERRRWTALAGSVFFHLLQKKADYQGRSSKGKWRDARNKAADLILAIATIEACARNPQGRPNVRDRCMAENVAWILEHEGPESKIVLWAHNGHVAHTPSMPGTGPMGAELECRFGVDHVVFGFSFNRGSFQAIHRPPSGGEGEGLRSFTVEPAIEESIDRVFSQANIPLFVLDLRDRPASETLGKWLGTPHRLRGIGAVFTPQREGTFYRPVTLPLWYDAMIFIDSTTRARPVPASP